MLDQKSLEAFQSKVPEGDRILLISYLVKSKVNRPFFKNVQSFAEINNYRIVVIPLNFINPTTETGYQKALEDEWFDPIIVPYLCFEPFTVGLIAVRADVRINPSNQNPVASVKSFVYTHTIFGHTSQNMGCKANSVYENPHQIWMTGHCSEFKSVKNLAVKRAEYTARYGFLLIEHGKIRNVHATRAGDFVDNSTYYPAKGEPRLSKNQAAILGDIHIGLHDESAIDWVFNKFDDLSISTLVLHDLFDGNSVNPHSCVKEQRSIFKDLGEEVQETRQWLQAFAEDHEVLLVNSNHHVFIGRWFKEKRGKDLTQAELDVYADFIKGGYPALFPEAEHIKYDHRIYGVAVGRHGHAGINGSKGSIMSDYKSGQRSIGGHSHEAGIMGGAERVGCLTQIPMGYNGNQLSTSAHSFAVLSENGKIQHFLR